MRLAAVILLLGAAAIVGLARFSARPDFDSWYRAEYGRPFVEWRTASDAQPWHEPPTTSPTTGPTTEPVD